MSNKPYTPEDTRGVVYRGSAWARITAADYDEAIEDLQNARDQIAPDGRNCAVCHDGGHQAWECHHNPLAMARAAAATEASRHVPALPWRCFHCDEVFENADDAREHFTISDRELPECLTRGDLRATAARLVHALDYRSTCGAEREHVATLQMEQVQCDLLRLLKRPAVPTAQSAHDAIRFYRADRPNGYLSNLYPVPVKLGGRTFPNAEYAYQYGKPREDKPEIAQWLMSAPSATLCAQAAHALFGWQIRPDWASTKVQRMRDVLRAKFTQHPELLQKLLATGDSEIVEQSSIDPFWGIGKSGRGKNMLGVLLTEIRAELQGTK